MGSGSHGDFRSTFGASKSNSPKGRDAYGDAARKQQVHGRSSQANLACRQASTGQHRPSAGSVSLSASSDSESSDTDGIQYFHWASDSILTSSDSDSSCHDSNSGDDTGFERKSAVLPSGSPPHSPTGSASAPSTDHESSDEAHRLMVEACMDTLVQSMKDCPVARYFAGNKAPSFVRREVVGYTKALPDARHFVSCADNQAVALWQLLPEETPANEFWAGWRRWFSVPLRRWRAMLDLEFWYESHHEAAAAEFGPHYYLSYLATRDVCRGKGLGSRLMAHMTATADAQGRFCVLEATSEASCRLYQRHGFVVREVFRVRPKAPPIFYMVRAPQPLAQPQLLQPHMQMEVIKEASASSPAPTVVAVAEAEIQPEPAAAAGGEVLLLQPAPTRALAVAVAAPAAA